MIEEIVFANRTRFVLKLSCTCLFWFTLTWVVRRVGLILLVLFAVFKSNWFTIKNKNEFAVVAMGGTATFSYTTNGGSSWTGCTNNAPGPIGGALTYMNNYYYCWSSYWYGNNHNKI